MLRRREQPADPATTEAPAAATPAADKSGVDGSARYVQQPNGRTHESDDPTTGCPHGGDGGQEDAGSFPLPPPTGAASSTTPTAGPTYERKAASAALELLIYGKMRRFG